MIKMQKDYFDRAKSLLFRLKSSKRQEVPRGKTLVDYVEDVRKWREDQGTIDVEASTPYYYYSLEYSYGDQSYDDEFCSSTRTCDCTASVNHSFSENVVQVPTQINVSNTMKPMEKLSYLLSTYCHHDSFQNELLLWTYKGRERLIIDPIESLLQQEDLPCDEKRFFISTFVTQISVAVQKGPYDENIYSLEGSNQEKCVCRSRAQ